MPLVAAVARVVIVSAAAVARVRIVASVRIVVSVLGMSIVVGMLGVLVAHRYGTVGRVIHLGLVPRVVSVIGRAAVIRVAAVARVRVRHIRWRGLAVPVVFVRHRSPSLACGSSFTVPPRGINDHNQFSPEGIPQPGSRLALGSKYGNLCL